MNILFLVQNYPVKENEWGSIFFKKQVEVISQFHNVVVVSFIVDYSKFRPFFNYTVEKISGQAEIYKVVVSRSFPVFNQLNYLYTTFRFIKKLNQQKKFDIIHSQVSYPAGTLAYYLKKSLNIPYILTEHSRIVPQYRSKIHRNLILKALKNADHLIAVSNMLKKEIYDQTGCEAEVVGNVINPEEFILKDEFSKDILNIGFAGNLYNSNKGLDVLINAASKLNIKFHLHIVGSGKQLESLKLLAKEKGIFSCCTFYGDLPPMKMPWFYNKLDIFVLASRYETFGIVIIEALASGIPVIATACGGPEDFVIPEVGILIEKENVDSLIKAINYMYSNHNNYEPNKLRKYVIDKFGPNQFFNRINRIYLKHTAENGL